MQILQTGGGDRTEHIPSIFPALCLSRCFFLYKDLLGYAEIRSISKRSSKLSTDSIDQLGRHRVQKTTPVPPSELSPQPLELD